MQPKVDSRTRAKARSSPSSKRCPTHQSKRYSCSGQCVAGALLADDLWSRCGVSLSPQRSRKQSRRSAGSMWNPQWRRKRQGNSLLAKKHPWALLTVCWQCAQPLEILIATERHALFRERSDHDEVSLDVQLWTCANSLRIYATAWLTSMVRSFPVLWNKERCRWASTTWACLFQLCSPTPAHGHVTLDPSIPARSLVC